MKHNGKQSDSNGKRNFPQKDDLADKAAFRRPYGHEPADNRCSSIERSLNNLFNYNIYAQIARKYLKEKGANIIDPNNRFYRDDRFMIGKCQSWVCDQHLESDYRAFQEAQLGPLKQRQNLLNIDIAKTKKYYAQLTEDDLCDCESCQYYRSIIEQACPEVTAYFLQLGIDIRKPYHLSFVDTEDGNLLYIDCDYLAFGDGDFAYYHKCGEQEITSALIYPDPDFDPPYVMLQINQVILPSVKTENLS